ncbi:MAG: hypothetical protein IEMM0006_1909 [bacterium]|nr:MAG: hypothetical protein IEMM0006_1909 [bacterium]
MKDLLNYLRNPVYCLNTKPKFTYFLRLYLYLILIEIPINLGILFITKEFHIKQSEVVGWSARQVMFLTILFSPVYEEILFRSLLKFKKINILLFIVTNLFLWLFAFFRSKMSSPVFYMLPILVFGLLSLLLWFGRDKIEQYISSNFKYFFYGTVLIFGSLHASNFTGNMYLILAFSPILGGPQIVGGLLLGYIRMKNGLVYSVLFHVLLNSVFLFHFL